MLLRTLCGSVRYYWNIYPRGGSLFPHVDRSIAECAAGVQARRGPQFSFSPATKDTPCPTALRSLSLSLWFRGESERPPRERESRFSPRLPRLRRKSARRGG